MKQIHDRTRLLREFRSIAARGRELWQSSGLLFYRDIAERAEQHIRELTTQTSPACDNGNDSTDAAQRGVSHDKTDPQKSNRAKPRS